MRKEELWLELGKKSRDIETSMDSLQRKRTGSYYTDLRLTDVMMDELVNKLIEDGKNISECSFFEPCVGAGNFVFSYLKKVYLLGLSKDEIKSVLDKLYVADINLDALQNYRQSLSEFVKEYWNIELTDKYFESHIGSGLLVDVSAEKLEYISLENVFPNTATRKFDIVVTNPPYKNLKAEKSQYATEEEYQEDKEKYNEVSKVVAANFKYSADGVLNLYKLFVEEIIDKYVSDDAYISLLIPSSLMSDKTCAKLRTHILLEKNLYSVKVINEGSGYIDAQQALVAILIGTKGVTSKVRITKDFCNEPSDEASVDIRDILNPNTENSLIALSEDEYEIYKKLRNFPVVKDLNFIINLRGELDLTAGKDFIVKTQTNHKLIRGRNIGYYQLISSNEEDYVDDVFLEKTKKSIYIEQERIICQQIANMHKERRVTFALAPAGCVLGNSCNFISVESNEYGIDIYTLLGLFNTKIINWLFKLTSSNNHINNYEIDCFPVPVKSPELVRISELSRKYISDPDEKIIGEIEKLAENAYGLNTKNEDVMKDNQGCDVIEAFYKDLRYVCPQITREQIEKILAAEVSTDEISGTDTSIFEKNVIKGIVEKYRKINSGEVLNHTTFKLSDLDLEMIKSVPQGGSWKDIPKETVAKSKRLLRITETGGRTTLYGRINYSKPSYTITTYFNRPGNGTYVHPVHERVLSVREAARFQGFQDDYLFFGNKTQLLKQVGNAVPTIFAYQIGKKIFDKTGCSKSIDLFCGAGGMTAGFKAAGIKSMLSNDIEESAVTTLKINNPEINVFCGDITQSETKEKIIETAKLTGVDIICGGPPCQGFSMAGFRDENDPRNQLFREFVYVVEHIKPKVIVFENVEGLLSYQGGQTYRDIHTLFSELGYNTEGRALLTHLYGVPQKRKRVIIICTRKDLGVMPADLYPDEITSSEENQITAKETIGDLENVLCSEHAKYIASDESTILKFFKKEISYNDYIELISSRNNLDADVAAETTFNLSALKTDKLGQLSFV